MADYDPEFTRAFADRILAELETDLGVYRAPETPRMSRLRLCEIRNALKGLLALPEAAYPVDVRNDTIDELVRKAEGQAKIVGQGVGKAQWSLIAEWLRHHKVPEPQSRSV